VELNMRIRVWQSYSCNNSSSYRLVARFSDPSVASDVASELARFLLVHAQQMDAVMEEGDVPNDPSDAATYLAQKYGFEWSEIFTWGDEMLVGDEPSVASEGGVLVMYHSYCGGFPPEIATYLKARGAKEIEKQERSTPPVSVLFRVPKDEGGDKLRDQLTKLFTVESVTEGRQVEDFTGPWSDREVYGDASFFSDGESIGFYVPIVPDELDDLKKWLAERGVDKPSIQLCEYGDLAKFDTIAKAKCAACQGTLKYLDPRVHGIEAEQLACAACGGMFDLKSLKA
jgi:hypothetical protein